MTEIATTPLDAVRKAQTGDMVQVGVLYEHYHVGVFRYLYYMLGDHQLAEDLTSEVFLRMIHSLRSYRLQGSPFRAWLYQIARNLAVDHVRRARRWEQVQVSENLPAAGDDPVSVVEQGLDSERLQRCLSLLNPDQRSVLILRFVVGLPISETAEVLHKSLDAVKALQRRGLAALRDMLSNWEVESD